MLLEMLVMLMSDLPFVDDVKKGESYLEGELGERYFVSLCFVMYLTYFVVLDIYFVVLDIFYFCVVDMYLLLYVFMSCMRFIFFIYDMT